MSGVKQEPIHGYIRLMPDKDKLKQHSIEVVGDKEINLKQQHKKKYTFDRVFGLKSSQLDVYNAVVLPIIPRVIQGYSCFVYAYGPTRTGKTYTLVGKSTDYMEPWNQNSEMGCIPRALSHLLDEMKNLKIEEAAMRVSYLELYNEEMVDLLFEMGHNDPMRIVDDPEQKGSVFVEHLTPYTVSNKEDIAKILQKASHNHQNNNEVLKNCQDGDSHKIFTITLYTRQTTLPGEEILKTGKLYFVEVADPGYSTHGDKPAREVYTLHQSREALFKVVKALEERHSYIPHKDSKLTRILQESLGGRGKTCFIATIDPQFSCIAETTNTLDFIKGVRKIMNNIEINKVTSKTNVLKCLTAEVDKYRKDLQALRSGSGFYVDAVNWDQMIKTDRIKRQQIAATTEKISDRETTLNSLQKGKELKIEEWNGLNERFRNLHVKALENKLHMLKTEKNLQHEKHITELYEKTVEAISQQNQELFYLVSGSVENLNALEAKLKFLLEKLSANYHISNEYFNDLERKTDTVLKSTDESFKESTSVAVRCKTDMEALLDSVHKFCQESFKKLDSIAKNMEQMGHILSDQKILPTYEPHGQSFFNAVHDAVKMLEARHCSLTKILKASAKKDSKMYEQKSRSVSSTAAVNTYILQTVEQEKQSITNLMQVADDCVKYVSKDNTAQMDTLDELASAVVRLKELHLRRQQRNSVLKEKWTQFLQHQTDYLQATVKDGQEFSDLSRRISDLEKQVSACRSRYSKPLPAFEFTLHNMVDNIDKTGTEFKHHVEEQMKNYSDEFVTLDTKVNDATEPLCVEIFRIAEGKTEEMVNIGKQLGQKIAYNIEKFIQIKDNIYSLHSKVNKSLKKVKETARDGVSQFKSIEYTEKNHDFLQYVLQEAAGVSAYKAEEIENIKGKMAMLNLNSKDKENMDPQTSSGKH